LASEQFGSAEYPLQTVLLELFENDEWRNTMVAAPVPQMVESIPFDEALAAVVVLSWNDLMPEPSSGLIHIEYHVDPIGSVEFVKVWASTIRGEWNLICEYWMRASGSHESGLRLGAGYKSVGLERMLESVLQNRDMFLVGTAPGSDRMIQVFPPTDPERVSATKRMSVLHNRLAPSDSERRQGSNGHKKI
jgi:hypothetical protein